jgi:ferritin-like metal-binding protein YciE
VLYVEQTLVKMLPKLHEEAADAELVQSFKDHLAETKQHVSNVEEAFRTLGEKPKAEKCPAIKGIKTEHDEFVEEEDPSAEVLDSFLTGAAARTEHYEIAAYEGLITAATAMSERRSRSCSPRIWRPGEGTGHDEEDRRAAREGEREALGCRRLAATRTRARGPSRALGQLRGCELRLLGHYSCGRCLTEGLMGAMSEPDRRAAGPVRDAALAWPDVEHPRGRFLGARSTIVVVIGLIASRLLVAE